MTPDRRTLLTLRIACVLTLVALPLMVWSLVQPTPLPVMLAMTIGQILGTLAFAMFLVVVARDVLMHLRELRKHRKDSP